MSSPVIFTRWNRTDRLLTSSVRSAERFASWNIWLICSGTSTPRVLPASTEVTFPVDRKSSCLSNKHTYSQHITSKWLSSNFEFYTQYKPNKFTPWHWAHLLWASFTNPSNRDSSSLKTDYMDYNFGQNFPCFSGIYMRDLSSHTSWTSLHNPPAILTFIRTNNHIT